MRAKKKRTRKQNAPKAKSVGKPMAEVSSSWYDSMAQISAAEKIPLEVLRVAKRNGCPNFKGGRVCITGLREWIAANAGKLNTASDPKDLRSAKLMQEIRKLKIQNDTKEGALILRSKVVENHARILGSVLPRVKQMLENEVPQQVYGLGVPDIRVHMKGVYDEIASVFNQAGELWRGS
jgi:hypothetical protein